MKRLLENYIDADRLPVQPYFAAFMIERGYSRARHIFERDGNGEEYQEWNRKMWLSFKKPRGISLFSTSETDHADFLDFLENRSADFACRNHVEGIAA